MTTPALAELGLGLADDALVREPLDIGVDRGLQAARNNAETGWRQRIDIEVYSPLLSPARDLERENTMDRFVTLSSLALAALTGCVTTGTHEALKKSAQAKQDELTGNLEACQERLAAVEASKAQLDAKLKAEQTRATGLEGGLAAEQAKVTAAERQVADLSKRLETTRINLEASRANLRAATKRQIAALEAQAEADRQRIVSLDAAATAASADVERLRAEVDSLTKERATLQGALQELERRRKQADARVAEFRKLIERFRPLIDAGQLRVKIADGRMVVELATDVLFSSGSAKLSGGGKAAVKEVATVLASVPGRSFQVEGHTDNVPISTKRYRSNWELASARAIRVVRAMIAGGLDPQRVSAASYSEFKPAADNAATGGRKANRRIEIVVVPDLSSLPGFEELKEAANGG